MSIFQNLAAEDKPREKLLFRGEQFCSDAELLALILQAGIRGQSVIDISLALLNKFAGIKGLQFARAGELQDFPGLGHARAAAVIATFALGRRALESRWIPGMKLSSSKQVFEHYKNYCMNLRKERFFVLLLNGKNQLLREELISEGTLNTSLVHPREVFNPAIRESAAAILAMHNHPSGDPTPSKEDFEVTFRLHEAGVLLGISLVDHLILGRESYFSFQEAGEI